MYKPANHILVIFGASGDLTRRKLLPALGELQKLKLLPDNFAVLLYSLCFIINAWIRKQRKIIKYSHNDSIR